MFQELCCRCHKHATPAPGCRMAPRKRNFAKKRARTAGSIPQRLCGHAVTAMGGKIYITGGYTTEGR